ncbi:hypothetical protein GCK72_006640 [Caenorhabditis remanei]|uniref:tRNA N(3)-cytidine methyltransferase METTL6 n=1 Tax=Caenorhabditis remanei TaxID=31234 RepID=A0A6A5HLC4_CAERE|nr:hypothetical protein GCK72_006640 [Caenorhabditis remanei]KAF1766682.1 hypothetical protein GCK72_006640 [Caenorhabditis remanei]
MKDEPIMGCAEENPEEKPKCNPFGTRFLTDDAKVFEHNAWDDVEWSEEQQEEAKRIVENQKTMKVDEEKALKLLSTPADQWDAFYAHNENRFFKDRNWLLKEFPELDVNEECNLQKETVRILEVGCGVGNTTFPLMQVNNSSSRLFLHSCDYAPNAIRVLKSQEAYDTTKMNAFVWDITQPAPEEAPAAESLDYIVCIYVLSAIHPDNIRKALSNLMSLLKPGGTLLLKDYGRYDLTQLRFKKNRLIDGNLYCRGDGTLVYFFEMDELESLLNEHGMEKKVMHVDRRLIVNRAKQNKKALLRLSCESLKFRPVFDEILQDKELKKMKNDPNIGGSVDLLYVLMYETLVGSGLNRCSQELKSVISRRSQKIKDVEKELEADGRGIKSIKEAEEGAKKIIIPRYARINTLKWTAEEAMKTLETEEWKLQGTASVENFAEVVGNMKEDEIYVDPHVENLLIFAPNIQNFHEYWMVEQRYLILQDKASCLPAFLLNPRPGSQVFDTCAAPGMKTSHAAAIMDNQGKVWAMDRAADRVAVMKQLLDGSKVAIASAFCGDFLKTDITDKKFSKVKFAIIDPPCSGSGIVKRMDEITGGNAEKERLEKLKNLQAMILKHALKLPGLKRAVYSTCSIHEEENEQVIDEVLLDTYVRQNFVLKKDVLPEWTHRGLKTYEVGEHCLRADPKVTLTNGFFVAVFERVKNNE